MLSLRRYLRLALVCAVILALGAESAYGMKCPRRLLQFNLRTLVLATLAVGVTTGVIVNPMKVQRERRAEMNASYHAALPFGVTAMTSFTSEEELDRAIHLAAKNVRTQLVDLPHIGSRQTPVASGQPLVAMPDFPFGLAYLAKWDPEFAATFGQYKHVPLGIEELSDYVDAVPVSALVGKDHDRAAEVDELFYQGLKRFVERTRSLDPTLSDIVTHICQKGSHYRAYQLIAQEEYRMAKPKPIFSARTSFIAAEEVLERLAEDPNSGSSIAKLQGMIANSREPDLDLMEKFVQAGQYGGSFESWVRIPMVKVGPRSNLLFAPGVRHAIESHVARLLDERMRRSDPSLTVEQNVQGLLDELD